MSKAVKRNTEALQTFYNNRRNRNQPSHQNKSAKHN